MNRSWLLFPGAWFLILGMLGGAGAVTKNVDIQVTHKTPTITVDVGTATAGQSIAVHVRNSPQAIGTDYVQLVLVYGHGASYYSDGTLSSINPVQNTVGRDYQYFGGAHNADLTFVVPSVPSDWNQQWAFKLLKDDGFALAAQSPIITVAPVLPSVAPSAPSPGFPDPFVPAQTLTVCPSGCNYKLPSQAVAAATGDNVLITIQAGVYNDSVVMLQSGPAHVWLKGVGGNFAHFTGKPINSKGTLDVAPNGILVLDNIEISDIDGNTNEPGIAGVFDEGTGDLWLRNVYIHDGHQGVITNERMPPTKNVKLLNSHFTRLGNYNTHNWYVGGGTASLDVENTISEWTAQTHEGKSRAVRTTYNCNRFVAAQNHWFPGSANIDLSEGSQATISNNLFVKGAYAFNGPYIVKWSLDREEADRGDVYWLQMQNNILISDQSSRTNSVLFAVLGPSYLKDPSTGMPFRHMNLARSSSTNNRFVGPNHGPGFDGYDYFPYDKSYIPGVGSAPPGAQPIADIPVNGDTYYDTRAAAGYGTTQLPVPSACTQSIGNVAIPMK